MGNFSSNGDKQNLKNGPNKATSTTVLKKDKHLILPEPYTNSTKKVTSLIRKTLGVSPEDSIDDVFHSLTNLEEIENDVFGRVKNDNLDFFPLRLYICHNPQKTVFSKLAGFVANNILKQEVGVAHLGVQIADIVLHWFDSSFVYVKDWKGQKATAVFYPQDIEGNEVALIENKPETRKAICKVIQRWNCRNTYSQRRNNCQNFVTEIFEAVELNGKFSEYSGWVGDFIRHVAQCKGDIFPSLVKGSEVLKTWKTHRELDEDHEEQLETYPEAASLLKAFHRAFQMREATLKERSSDHEELLENLKDFKKEFDPTEPSEEHKPIIEDFRKYAKSKKKHFDKDDDLINWRIEEAEAQFEKADEELKIVQGCDCPVDSPTLLVGNDGVKKRNTKGAYTSGIDSSLPTSNAYSGSRSNKSKVNGLSNNN